MPALIDGKYEVLEKLKEGGMGAIFRVRHVLLDEIRVIKTMRPQIEDDPEARKRFFREAKMATNLRHPNVAAMLDFVAEGDSFYMVMEFIDGVNLAEYVGEKGPPSLVTALEIGAQALDALGYLHKRGIVHRDVSPENLMLTREHGGDLRVKLIDLGVAKEAEGEGLTATGMFVGKLKYGSPEQLGVLKKGEKMDGRSDLYSMGCVLFLLLTGQPAVEAETPQAYIVKHTRMPPRSFDEVDTARKVPDDVREIVLKALARSRDDRWPTAEDFASALRAARDRLLDGPTMPPSADLWISQLPIPGAGATGATMAVVEPETIKVDPPFPTRRTSIVAPERPAPRQAGRPRGDGAFSKRALVVGGATVVVIGIAIAGVLLRTPAPPLPPGIVLVTSAPWGNVEVRDLKTNEMLAGVSGKPTPARLAIPPGRYRVLVRPENPAAPAGDVEVDVVSGRETRVNVPLPGFDLDEAVSAYVR